MSICIGSDCYEKVVKNKTVYFIRGDVFATNVLNADSDDYKLMQMSDFVFDVIKQRNGVEEMIKRHC